MRDELASLMEDVTGRICPHDTTTELELVLRTRQDLVKVRTRVSNSIEKIDQAIIPKLLEQQLPN